MANSISSMLNSRMRLTGLSSGLDIDSMVQQLMKVERMKVDKVKQDKTLLEWKRDDYRSITNLLMGLRSDYFDVLKASTNFRSDTAFASFNSTSSNESVLTVTAGSGATTGSFDVTVTSIAATAKKAGASGVSKGYGGLAGVNPVNMGEMTQGKAFNVTLDGVTKTITLDRDYTGDTAAAFATALEGLLDAAFGTDKISVTESGGVLTFTPANTSSTLSIGGELRDDLGFTSSFNSNRINLNSTLQDINLDTSLVFDVNGNLSFSINGVDFSAHKDEKLSDVLNRINTSSAGVNIKYDSLNDRFVMETKNTGTTAYINNANTTGNFFVALKLDTAAEERGTNAVLTIDGTAVERTTNKFTIEGIAYDIKATGTTTVTISSNPDALIEKIKGFVTKYNEVVAKINGKLTEERFRSYLPLTDEQKSAMKEKDIELWEEKAKSGLLRHDSILQNIQYSMRKALYDKIDGLDFSLYDIGITTSSSYRDGGQLVINEDKLRQAIIDNSDKVAQLFAKESRYSYEDSANRTARYNEEGIAQRLYDIIQDNIRTTRDGNGRKGVLLEKAGIAGDITEFDSLIVDEIKAKENLIDTLYEKLTAKENAYYEKFTAMERILSQMNAQSAWLSQQFGQQQ